MLRTCLALALAGLAACAAPLPGGRIYNTDFDPIFADKVVLGGAQEVVLAGAPPAGLAPEGFTAMLRAPGWYPPTRFVPAAPGRPEGFHFVAAFGSDVVTALCRRPSPGGDPALIGMALCLGERQISRAAIRLSEGPVEPQLHALMRALLPPPQPDDTGPPRIRLRGN